MPHSRTHAQGVSPDALPSFSGDGPDRGRAPYADRLPAISAENSSTCELEASAGQAERDEIRVGVIDRNTFTRDLLVRALAASDQHIAVTAYHSVDECTKHCTGAVDVLLHYLHADELTDLILSRDVVPICKALPRLPLIVLLDTAKRIEASVLRRPLEYGVHAIIPTRTVEVQHVAAALHVVGAGGTYAFDDVPEPDERNLSAGRAIASSTDPLTPRQKLVLTHLRKGKANKAIAYELGVSANTVKVHIRNIMRRMGARNRTEAVYKLQQWPPDIWHEVVADY